MTGWTPILMEMHEQILWRVAVRSEEVNRRDPDVILATAVKRQPELFEPVPRVVKRGAPRQCCTTFKGQPHHDRCCNNPQNWKIRRS